MDVKEKEMNGLLAIGIARDGIAETDGRDRAKFDEILDMLLGCEKAPATLCFYGEGIRWLTKESPVIDKLEQVCTHGVEIVACRHCMAEAGLLGDMAVGRLATEDHVNHILRHAEHAMVL
jgi:intracellular sulfur oxidation DsrE/DsrF family protein